MDTKKRTTVPLHYHLETTRIVCLHCHTVHESDQLFAASGTVDSTAVNLVPMEHGRSALWDVPIKRRVVTKDTSFCSRCISKAVLLPVPPPLEPVVPNPANSNFLHAAKPSRPSPAPKHIPTLDEIL